MGLSHWPPLLAKRYGVAYYVSFFIGVGIGVLFLARLAARDARILDSMLTPAFTAVLGALVAAAVGYILFVDVSVTPRWLEQSRKSGFLLCGHCGYVLQGAAGGACPECGTAYEPGNLQLFWYRYSHLPKGRRVRLRMPQMTSLVLFGLGFLAFLAGMFLPQLVLLVPLFLGTGLCVMLAFWKRCRRRLLAAIQDLQAINGDDETTAEQWQKALHEFVDAARHCPASWKYDVESAPPVPIAAASALIRSENKPL